MAVSEEAGDDMVESLRKIADELERGGPAMTGREIWTLVLGSVEAGFISQNCLDSNGEPANVVDGLFAIAGSIESLAKAVGQR